MTRPLSDRYQAREKALRAAYEFSPADEVLLPLALAAYDLRDELEASARAAGISTKEGRALLSAARDAALVGLRHWLALGFPKADAGAPRRPGRQPGENWSRQRRQARGGERT